MSPAVALSTTAQTPHPCAFQCSAKRVSDRSERAGDRVGREGAARQVARDVGVGVERGVSGGVAGLEGAEDEARRLDHGHSAPGPPPGQDVGRVMVDEEPVAAPPLEDIRREEGRHGHLPSGMREDVLRAGDPAEVGVDVGAHVADAEAHLPASLEDGVPRFPHRVPAHEQRPARMNAPDVVRVRPDLLHLAEVEALERAVEARIRLDELGLVLVRGQVGHVITRSLRRRSTTRFYQIAPE